MIKKFYCSILNQNEIENKDINAIVLNHRYVARLSKEVNV